MTDQPLVSVVVPTYNRPDFLEKTMRSILEQSYENIELIVVSNGQSDENKKMVQSFDDLRVRYVDQDNSGGPASPRNHGIKLSKGKYIAVCDDDDLWLPKKLEKQISAMEAHPACGLCYTGMVFFNESGKEWSAEQVQADFKSLLFRNVVPISSVVVRADLCRELGGFDESKYVGDSEDYEFVLRFAYHAPLAFIDEELLRYWAGENRTTATDEARKIVDDWRYFKDVSGCFYQVMQKTKSSLIPFIVPFLCCIKRCLKSSAYITCKRLGFV